jgi:hypothetical protein
MGNFTESTGRAIRPSIAGHAARRGAIVSADRAGQNGRDALEEFDYRSGLADLTFRQAAGKLDP